MPQQAPYTIVLANGFRRMVYGEVTSTNHVCLQMAKAGDAGNLWVTAEHQSAGKGSRGRSWVSQSGNLFASLLLCEPCEDQYLATLTFVASLAIRDCLDEIAQNQTAEIKLKWPNDVLLNGKKVSGILLESHRVNDKSAVIIGIGVNISDHPEKTLYPATSLSRANIKTSVEQMFDALSITMAKRLGQWNKGVDFDATRKDWLENAAGLGQSIQVKLPIGSKNVTRAGILEGLDEDGLLILLLPDGQRQKYSVADIFFA